MTQELACLLIGLGCLVGSCVASKRADNLERYEPLAALAGLLFSLGITLIGIAAYGYISSLPSIKEVGR